MFYKSLTKRTERIVRRIEILAKISDAPNHLLRTYGSTALEKANAVVAEWMEAAGLEVYIDTIGNVRGRLPATNNSTKVFVLGSHLDTVKNAGKYDGPLGVLIALDIVEELKKKGGPRPFNIEVVGFCDEEGVRFTTTYLGSSALSNTFREEWLELEDDDGISLGEIIEQRGGSLEAIQNEGLSAKDCLGFYEVHIEQGPILEKENISVGVVTSIAAQLRAEIRFTGKAGHAGTTPMDMRQNALCAAAQFILATESYAKSSNGEIIATVGKLSSSPNVSNVIPNEAHCSLDLRSHDEASINKALEDLKAITVDCCNKREIAVDWNVLQQNGSVFFEPHLCKLLERASQKAGIQEVIKLVSGAGHDAVALSHIMPVCMLFVQCRDGISHHPDEFVAFEHIQEALSVSDFFMCDLVNFHQNQILSRKVFNQHQVFVK